MSNDVVKFDASPCPDLPCRQWTGRLDAAGLRIGLVVSRYNEALTSILVRSAVEALIHHGAAAGDVEVAWVPGAYEIPLVVETLARTRRFHALIALGCVIQGETPHASLINTAVANALLDIARGAGVPVIDCVVSANTPAQAEARCRPGREGRGWYAACAAVGMARLLSALPGARP